MTALRLLQEPKDLEAELAAMERDTRIRIFSGCDARSCNTPARTRSVKRIEHGTWRQSESRPTFCVTRA